MYDSRSIVAFAAAATTVEIFFVAKMAQLRVEKLTRTPIRLIKRVYSIVRTQSDKILTSDIISNLKIGKTDFTVDVNVLSVHGNHGSFEC